MEIKANYKRFNADIVETYGPVGFPATSQEKILIRPYARRFQVKPSQQMGLLQLAGFQDSFYKWYKKLEEDRQIFIDNVNSGRDTYRNEVLLPFLADKVSQIGSGKGVFDIGCGTGEAVLTYLPENLNYVGIDSSEISLNKLISRFRKGRLYKDNKNVWRTNKGALRVANFGALPASIPMPNKVPLSDYTVASMILHHIPNYDIRQSLNTLSQITERNGSLLVVTFDSKKRKYIDDKFKKITERTEQFTRGEYHLPNGILPDEYIYFHGNSDLESALEEDFGKVQSYPLGDFFRVFEAKKTKNK